MAAIADEHDVLIIGGGITGAALAYLATQTHPPLRVALIEAGELASGTSSRSSRFLHGGLRYLAQGRLGLVRRLLQGRAELARLAPHLVRPAPFILPYGPHTPHSGWLLRAALHLYGALEGRAPRPAGIPAPRRLNAAEVRRIEPLLAGVPMTGGLTYGELTVDDAGLVRALATAACAAGATVRTQLRCEGMLREGSRVTGIIARDTRGSNRFVIRARVVIDATGPWGGPRGREQRRLRLARGTHLVLPTTALPLTRTLVFFAPGDGRALFASPREGHVIVGTTEVEHHGTADVVQPTTAEIDYLLRALAAALPAARLPAHHGGVTAFAGVRPLAMVGDNAAPSGGTGDLDRDYAVDWDEPGLLSVRGGKLTLALDGARRALRAVGAAHRQLGLPALVIPTFGRLPGPLPAAPPVPTVEPLAGARHPFFTGRAA